MAQPALDAPAGSMLPGLSAHGEIAAEMDDLGLAPEPRALPRSSARSGRRYPNGELVAQLGDLRLVSEVAAPPWDSTTRTEPMRSTRRRDGPSEEPDSTADRTVSRQSETSSSAVSSPRTASARLHPHGDTSDSECEDSGKTSKPSNSMPGRSANGNAKPSKQPGGSSIKKKLKTAGIVVGVAAGRINCAYGRDCKHSPPYGLKRWCLRCYKKYIFNYNKKICEELWWKPEYCETCNFFRTIEECRYKCIGPQRNLSWLPKWFG
ncbi:uncharacterized protein LOC119402169 isoform X2 [Rhipicephalus sanguineus]|uniref:uncharacterized protein LOC119402169 isoform X2 n=1 Tax=Rhipicephalus sanguineus TaxID=34632 RepID=UPI001895F127|nr:uncharacterized protein LOC119402169 isoform X2 [Rhipicephalus sanguineus]